MDVAQQGGVGLMVLLAGIGGLMLSMMNLWDDSKRPKNERVPKDLLYVVFFFFWPVAGAVLAWIYVLDGSSLRPFLAFSIGLSAPTTIQALIKTASTRNGPPDGAEES